MDYRKHLNDVRAKLATKQVSLLVGSGFSKNVSSKFLSWEELLFDLVYQMNKDVFCDEFLRAAKTSYRGLDRTAYMRQKCSEVISKRGYLDIVSDYLKQTSPEAITTYIEDRTPYLEYENDELVMELGGNRQILKPESLGLHRMILELPWNNVYTTNYDQLLDICVDETQFQTFSDEIEQLRREISDLNKDLSHSIKQSEELDLSVTPSTNIAESNGQEILQPVGMSQEELHKKKEEYRQTHQQYYSSIKAKQEQIEIKEQAQVNCFNVVRSAGDLQLKRNNNIIKLHGSLRNKEQRKSFSFGFDGDHKKQYIISREHYEDYPIDHEPFTQLMRISLLQESFCLIGFSGDDPNFLAWVHWVKDILRREVSKTKKSNSYKIYLIDVNETPLDPARELFFENYNILRIPLMAQGVLDLIRGSEALPTGPERIKHSIQMFLNFLGDHEKMNLVIPASDLSVISQWQAVWGRLNFYSLDLWQSRDLVAASLVQLEPIRKKITIPPLKDLYVQNQEKILKLLVPGNMWYLKKEFYSDALRLLLHAVHDSFFPLTYALDQAYIDKLLAEPATARETQNLLNISLSMSSGLALDEATGFQKTLALAFSFKFEELSAHLKKWQPATDEVMKKAGFLSFLSVTESEELLESELRNHEQFSPEQRLYVYELLAFVKMTKYWSRDQKLDKMIAAFKVSGFISIEENLRHLYEKMGEKPERPEPLGKGRYSVGQPQEDDEHPNTRYALKFLMLLVQSGFQLNVRRASKISAPEWYQIINKGFEIYPSAFLFYGLQLDNEDYLRRLGQDYASSAKLENGLLDSIAINLLDGVKSVHHEYKKNSYIFLSAMLIGVDPEIWESKFMHLWRKGVADLSVFEEQHRNLTNPLNAFALKYLKIEAHLLEVLKNCLEEVVKGDKDIVTNYLYYLNRNVHYNELKRNGLDINVIDLPVQTIIEKLSLDNAANLKVLANIHALLNEDHKLKITEKLRKLDFSKIQDPRVLQLSVYFLKDEAAILNGLKSELINSSSLWYSGIHGDTVYMGSHPLELSRITADATTFGGLSWTDQELITIYEKLKVGLPDLKRHTNSHHPWGSSFEELISEMFWFVSCFKEKLNTLDTFPETESAVKELYHSNVTYDSLEQGLISGKRSEVVYALNELAGLFYKGDIRRNLIITVLNKVLFQAEPGVEAALSYLPAWFSHKNGVEGFEGLQYSLIGILNKFKAQPLKGADRSFVEERLVRLAFSLKESGAEAEVLDYWITYAGNSRFNNIKQFLAKREYQKASVT